MQWVYVNVGTYTSVPVEICYRVDVYVYVVKDLICSKSYENEVPLHFEMHSMAIIACSYSRRGYPDEHPMTGRECKSKVILDN